MTGEHTSLFRVFVRVQKQALRAGIVTGGILGFSLYATENLGQAALLVAVTALFAVFMSESTGETDQ